MTAQTLPSAARDYHREQRDEHREAVAAVLRRWRRIDPSNFAASWARQEAAVVTIVTRAQRRIIAGSAAYVPDILEDTGQTADIPAAALLATEGFVSMAGSGRSVADVLSLAPIRAKQAVRLGLPGDQALGEASRWLSATVGTILSDTGRGVEGLAMAVRPVTGYVRMLVPPSCARCVVQAGKRFRTNAGFPRHPRCDCRHIPASEAVADDLTVDPRAYFDSLDDAARLKFAGSRANAKALADGADIGQIVNAYRRSGGMQLAQVSPIKTRDGLKFTTEGTTRRALAHRAQTSLRRNGSTQMRLMPESIYTRARDHDDALRMLRLYGWIH